MALRVPVFDSSTNAFLGYTNFTSGAAFIAYSLRKTNGVYLSPGTSVTITSFDNNYITLSDTTKIRRYPWTRLPIYVKNDSFPAFTAKYVPTVGNTLRLTTYGQAGIGSVSA